MKKTYPSSKKARSPVAFHVHLRPEGKRAVNKSTRKAFKKATATETGHADE